MVHPDWIVASIKQNRQLPVQKFLYRGFSDVAQSSIASHLQPSPSLEPASSTEPQPLCPNPSRSLRDLLKGKQEEQVEAPQEREQQQSIEKKDSAKASISRQPPVHESLPPTVVNENKPEEAAVDTLPTLELTESTLHLVSSQPSIPEQASVEPIAKAKTAPLAIVPKATRAADTSALRTNSTKDGPAFVRHFFAKSRLHHIGGWRQTFQQKAREFQAKYKGRALRRAPASSNDRVILHVDMDCFFVAVALRDRPDCQHLPIAVAHSENAGSSEVSSCNYLARAKGVRAGMFMHTAKQLCPELVVLPYQFEAIEKISCQIYDIFFSHTPYVQSMSCDEALLEFEASTDGVALAVRIRDEIFTQTQCSASVGISFNILLAKMASKRAKPDGIFQIRDLEQAEAFMSSRKITDLPGVGRRMTAQLEVLGLQDMPQVLSISKNDLVRHFGKTTGEMLYHFARGIDTRPLDVEANMMRKSVSAVINFGIRFETWEDSTEFLKALAEEMTKRLQSLKVKTKCLTLQIKKRQEGAPIEPSKFMGHGVCDSFSKSQVLANATDDTEVIARVSIELLRQFRFESKDLRGVGIQATKLTSTNAAASAKSGQLVRAWLNAGAEEKGGDNDANHPSDTVTAIQHVQTGETRRDFGVQFPEVDSNSINDGVQVQETSEQAQATTTPIPGKGKRPLHKQNPLFMAARSTPQTTRTSPHSMYSLNEVRISQVDADVYDALPFQIRKEIDRYAKKRTTLVPSVPKRGLGPMHRSKPPIAPSKGNHNRSVESPVNSTVMALNDLRMSQVDADVYQALPSNIQKEIDRHAKKRPGNSTDKSIAQQRNERSSPSKSSNGSNSQNVVPAALKSIEDLVQNLLDTSADPNDIDQAFDAVYSRILHDVERRQLDQVLRMLRFLRRKCSSTGSAKKDLLSIGFNRVLQQANHELLQHFHGSLAVSCVAPL